MCREYALRERDIVEEREREKERDRKKESERTFNELRGGISRGAAAAVEKLPLACA